MDLQINLGLLQEKAVRSFDKWDQAVLDGDTSVAKEARREITGRSKQAIERLPSNCKTASGLYLFANSNEGTARDHRLAYFGIAPKQNLGKRIGDYLEKEISVLDPELLRLDENEASEKIIKRLSIAMPTTDPETIKKKYTVSHLKSRLMSRSDTIYLYPVQASKQLLEDAESVLIQAGLSCGQELVNKQKIKKMKREPVADSRDLALGALDIWARGGVDRQLCSDLKIEIQRMMFSN